ncbi:MAG: hydrogenase expression/formation protein HypE [Candidatus Bathyarchaeia archaeon]
MESIRMEHGAGGAAMQRLIKERIIKRLGGSGVEVPLEAMDDSAVVNGIVLKSDSYTVKPIFFPGGDIGRLSVSGTVNDIAVMGGRPLALASGLIIEEGFPLQDLDRILESMAKTCSEASVFVVTGDTKVVEKGGIDAIVINMSGIGIRSPALDSNLAEVRRRRALSSQWLLDSNLADGDVIIVSGTIGDHGIAIMSCREGYGFEGNISSDVAPLNGLVESLLEVGGIVAMKDPTRGGLSNALNEWAQKSNVGILIHEDRIPIKGEVRAACEMLGIDPLDVGNEGKLVIGVVAEKAEEVLEELRRHELGRDAEVIGHATKRYEGVVMRTQVGGLRVLPPPIGDPIPRIC